MAALVEERRRLERQVAELQKKLAVGGGGASDVEEIAGVKLTARNLGDVPARDLKGIAEAIGKQNGSGVVALVSVNEGKASVVVGSLPRSDGAVQRGGPGTRGQRGSRRQRRRRTPGHGPGRGTGRNAGGGGADSSAGGDRGVAGPLRPPAERLALHRPAPARSLRLMPRPRRSGTSILPSLISRRSLNSGSNHSKCSTQGSRG